MKISNHLICSVVTALVLIPAPVAGASRIFECISDGQTTYSERPCAPFTQQRRIIIPDMWPNNRYPGRLRPGEASLLNRNRGRQQHLIEQRLQADEDYSSRLQRLNEQRRSRANQRRHIQSYEPRGISPWR